MQISVSCVTWLLFITAFSVSSLFLVTIDSDHMQDIVLDLQTKIPAIRMQLSLLVCSNCIHEHCRSWQWNSLHLKLRRPAPELSSTGTYCSTRFFYFFLHFSVNVS